MRNRVWVIALAVLCSTGLAFAQNTARDEAGAPQSVRFLAPIAASQPIATPPDGIVAFDNGPLITHPGGGAGGLDASALQTMSGMTIFGFGQQQSAGNRVGDDFTVPSGQTWRLDSVTLYAYQTGSGTTSSINAVNIQIWNGVPAAPGSMVVFGDTTTNRLTASTFSNIYRVLDTTLTDTARPVMVNTVSLGVTLPAGTYWLDWQTGGSASFSGPWQPPVTILGQTTTGNGMQSIGGVWAPLADVGGQGLPFKLNFQLAPAALVVTGGNANGVIEAGEAVNLETAWMGGPIAVAAVTGTATADSTFTLTDNAAAYGTIGVNATVSCTGSANCYAGSATGPRPGTHWDGTLTETLSTTEVKAWKLHVGGSFTDVPMTSGFYRFVETLLHKGITGGCGTDTYCPSNAATREQMAPFVLVAKEGAGYSPVACGATPMFADVPVTSGFCKFIEELARRGVVSGCAPSLYCPTDPVTRAQMSIFTLRTLDPALNPPACGTPMFNDVPASNPFCKWIEELARRGVVTGCGGGNYCPNDSVTRDQMAVFISATFSLTLYGI